MSFFSSIISSVAPILGVVAAPFTGGASLLATGVSLASNFLGSSSSSGGGLASALSGTGSLGGFLSSMVNGLGSLMGGAANDLSSLVSSLGDGIKSLFTSGFNDFLSSTNSILTEIHNGINDVSKLEASVVTPIADLVNGLTTDVQALNDQVIAPIRNLIDTYNKSSTTLLTSIQSDLHSGLTGMLKLPQDLTNAFTSVDAQFSRATQELGAANTATVKDVLVPGLVEGIGGPMSEVAARLAIPEFQKVDGAAFQVPVALEENSATPEYMAAINTILGSIEGSTGIIALVLKFIYDGALAGTYLTEMALASTRPAVQEAMAKIQPELLGVGETMEAWRRGILSQDDAQTELLKHGISGDRQAVLYELAQFLFGPREAIELYQRGIISSDDFNTLIAQNNVSASQAASLLELMQARLGAPDIAAANARGYVSDAQAIDLYQAALIPPSLQSIIPSLELSLVNPDRLTEMWGRQQAAEAGLMRESLLSPPPPEIEKQFDRTQAEPGSAQLAWMRHWDVPGAAWWVDAMFRGLRTRTEVEQAFQALRIPPEIWADIIAVEEELPPVWLVPDIVKTGVWSRDQAVPTLMKLGFSEENANVLYDYGYAARKVSVAVTADSLAKVSLGNAKSAFDDGLIDAATYEQILIDHKYTEAAAKLTVELAQYNLEQTALKNQANLLLEQVKLGMLSQTQAEDQLYNLGMTTAQVATYLDKIETAKVLNAKLPTEAQVEKMYKAGIIDEAQSLATLSLFGYSDTWAQRIFALW